MITKDDLRQLIGRIKVATGKTQRQISVGAGYSEDSLSELAAQKKGNYEPAYRQLELVYGEVLKNSIPVGEQKFTADQLFHMYMKAMERQDRLLETQLVLLEDIKKGMAKEASLDILTKGQAGGLAVLLEILNRDLRREAGGNPEKEMEIRAELVRRIGPKLNADLQTDISAHEGR